MRWVASFQNAVGDDWVDFYKANMYTQGDKPFLFKMKDAAEIFKGPRSSRCAVLEQRQPSILFHELLFALVPLENQGTCCTSDDP